MNEDILISIIVPFYNDELYMDKMLDSVINQTYKNYEVIFIDDGSTDKGIEKINRVILEHELCSLKYKIIRQKNQGVSCARNQGIKNASGKYIYFLDSDDYVEYNLCEDICKIIEKEDMDVILFRYDTIKNNKIIEYSKTSIDNNLTTCEILKMMLLGRFNIHMCSMVIKKEIILNNKLSFTVGARYGEDIEFIIKALYHSNYAYISNNIRFHYTINEGSVTEKFDSSRKDSIESAVRIEQYIKNISTDKEIVSLLKKNVAGKLLYNYYKYIEIGKNSNLLSKHEKIEIEKLIISKKRYFNYIDYGESFNFKNKIHKFLMKISPKLYFNMLKLREVIEI